MATEVVEVNEQSLRTELATVQQVAITIKDQATYNEAVLTLTKIKSFRKTWAEFWSPKKDAAHKSWRMLCDAFNEGDAPAAKAEGIVKAEILRFDQEQERIERERQAEAQRKAEAEAAERNRIAAEAVEAERQRLAAEAEAQGLSDDDIDAMLESVPEPEPEFAVVAAVVQPTYARASNVSKRDNWGCEVTDLKALCKAIGGGKFKLSPEDTAKAVEFFGALLKPQAVANKSTLAIPGCRAVNNQIISGRTK